MTLFVLVCVLVYSVSRYHDLSCLYLVNGCDPVGYVAYPFLHASFAHLAINMITMLSFWERMNEEHIKAFIISVILSFPAVTYISVSEKPTIGASGLAFCLIGSYLSSLLLSHGKKTFLRYLSLVSMLMITQSLLARGSVNWKIHASSLFLSLVISCVYMKWIKRRS